MLVTFKDLAKLKGVSAPAVTKKMKKDYMQPCIVNHNGQKLVNKDMALELWHGNSNIAQTPVTVPAETKKELKRQIDEMPADEIPDFNVSRARKEFYTAKLAEIEVGVKKAELIPAKEVKKKSFELSVGIREAFLTLPDRVSNLFASETDATVIDAVMRQEIYACLERFSETV